MKLNREDIRSKLNYSNYFVLVSFFGLLFLVFIYLWTPNAKNVYYFQKSLISVIFMVICISGMLAAVFPSRCRGITKFNINLNRNSDQNNGYGLKRNSESNKRYESSRISGKDKTNSSGIKSNLNSGRLIRFEGHHPNCGRFESHTILFMGRNYCPGCSGLLVGAIIAVIGTLLYYFMGLVMIYGEISFWTGAGTVLISLALIFFLNNQNNIVKFISNATLVLGSLLILVGIDTVKENIVMEFYFFLLVLFWIRARIAVSERNHEIICNHCRAESYCIYE